MEKLVYVSYDPRALGLCAERERFDAPAEVERCVLYTLEPSPLPEAPTAVLTCWLACVDRRSAIERFLSHSGAHFHGYVATEASLVRREIPEATRATLEFLTKPAALGRQVWLDSLELSHEGMEHGLLVARNVFTRALAPNAPAIDVMREGVGARAKDDGESGGERVSHLGQFTAGRGYVGERLTLRRGRLPW